MSSDSRELRLEQALAEYLRQVEAGQVDRRGLLEKYTDLRSELASFFHNHDGFERLAEPIRDAAAGPETVTISSDAAVVTPGVVRYFGDYELLDEIARGGMGVVYKARQASLDRVVALKMILAGELASPDAVQRFRHEAQSAANLDHPHIVPIYEVGEHNGRHYFSMKLIEGSNLSQEIGEPGAPKTPARRAASLVATVARAVHHAHQRGVLHRDLKPSNILLDADGQPHVTDFGLAKRVDPLLDAPTMDVPAGGSGSSGSRPRLDLTVTGAIVGTPSYMSPEQARATEELTTAADVYAIGAVLYALLTGRPPHVGTSMAQTLVDAMTAEPASPSRVFANVDRDLETVCLKCLSRDPTKRYDSAAAIADDLDRWLAGQPILARPASGWERTVKWTRRHPQAAALVGVSAFTVVAVIALLAWSNRQIRDEEGRTKSALASALVEQQRADAERIVAVSARAAAVKERSTADEARRLAERRLYVPQVLVAQTAIANRQVAQAIRALDGAPEEFRGWEWRYLNQTASRHVPSLPVEHIPQHLRWAADGKTVFFHGYMQKSGRVDVRTGKATERNVNVGYGGMLGTPAGRVAVNRDQSLVAYHDMTGLSFWDLRNDTVTPVAPRDRRSTEPPHARAVCFSPDEKLVFRVGGGAVECWDVATRKLEWSSPFPAGPCLAAAVSADGGRLVAGADDRTACLIDLATRKEILRTKPHQNQVDELHFTKDAGDRFITSCVYANPRLWDTKAGEMPVKLSGIYATSTRLNGSRSVASTTMSDGTVAVWSTDFGNELRVLKGHTDYVHASAFSPDGKTLATVGRDRTLRLWDVAEHRAAGRLVGAFTGHTDEVVGVDWSPDGRWIATGGSREDGIRLWDADVPPNPLRIATKATNIQCWAAFPDNRHVVLGTKRLANGYFDAVAEVWDLKTGKLVREFATQRNGVSAVAVSPESDWMVVAAEDGSVIVFDVATGKPIRTLCPAKASTERENWWSPRPTAIATSKDGSLVAVGRFDGRILLFDSAGRERWQVQRSVPADWVTRQSGMMEKDGVQVPARMEVADLRFTPDGKWLVAVSRHGAKIVTIHSAGDGRVAWQSSRLEWREGAWAMSPDGSRVAAGMTEQDVRVETVDLTGETPTTGKPIRLPADQGQRRPRVDAMAFAPNQPTLAISRERGVVERFEVRTGVRLFPFRGHDTPVRALAWLPDGSRLITGGGDRTVKLWELGATHELLSLPLGEAPSDRVEQVLVTPDGSRILATNAQMPTGDGGTTVMVWHAPK